MPSAPTEVFFVRFPPDIERDSIHAEIPKVKAFNHPMKPFFVPTLLLLFAFTNALHAATDVDVVQAQVKGFYRWYIHELNHDPQANPRKSPVIHRYISKHFLDALTNEEKKLRREGDGLDHDPFIMGQDWDKGWEHNIRVKDMEPEGKKWRVQVELSGKEINSHRLNLILITEEGVWKIDKIADGDTH